MTEPESLKAPKHIVFTMGVVIIILAVAVLILLLNRPANSKPQQPVEPAKDVILDGVNVPIPPELEKWIRSEGFSTLMLVKENKVKLVTPGGRERKPTCRLNGTEVPEACAVNGIDMKNLNSVELLSFKPDRDCDGERIGGYLFTWHTEDGPNGRWQEDDEPCHNKGASYHD